MIETNRIRTADAPGVGNGSARLSALYSFAGRAATDTRAPQAHRVSARAWRAWAHQ